LGPPKRNASPIWYTYANFLKIIAEMSKARHHGKNWPKIHNGPTAKTGITVTAETGQKVTSRPGICTCSVAHQLTVF